MFEKKEYKPYLFFNCECSSVKSLEYSTWFSKAQNATNSTCKLSLEYWDTNQKLFCLESKQIYVATIGIKDHGDIQSFITVVQKVQAHTKKRCIIYPGDVKLLEMPRVI